MAADIEYPIDIREVNVSTHSHPKVAASNRPLQGVIGMVSTHSHPKVAANSLPISLCGASPFQHTATRRWLQPGEEATAETPAVSTHSHPKVAAIGVNMNTEVKKVSTHSHPKVAAHFNRRYKTTVRSFNTQPPEGGCFHGL